MARVATSEPMPLYSFESSLRMRRVALGILATFFFVALIYRGIKLPLFHDPLGLEGVLWAAFFATAMSPFFFWYGAVKRYEVWSDRVHLARFLHSTDVFYAEIRGFRRLRASPLNRLRSLMFGAPITSAIEPSDAAYGFWGGPKFFALERPDEFLRAANAAYEAWAKGAAAPVELTSR